MTARKEQEQKEETETKSRKVTQGPIKDKARTMRKLLDAVGKVLINEGYTGLTVAKIAAAAKLNRKLIYLYFGSVDNLIETYIKERDFWSVPANDGIATLLQEQQPLGSTEVSAILEGQFASLLQTRELQKIILWEISQKNELMLKIANDREAIGEQLFAQTHPFFDGTDVDLRALIALQIGGIYYLSLHAKANGSTFCGIDINEPEGQQRIANAIKQVVNYSYDLAREQKAKQS